MISGKIKNNIYALASLFVIILTVASFVLITGFMVKMNGIIFSENDDLFSENDISLDIQLYDKFKDFLND